MTANKDISMHVSILDSLCYLTDHPRPKCFETIIAYLDLDSVVHQLRLRFFYSQLRLLPDAGPASVILTHVCSSGQDAKGNSLILQKDRDGHTLLSLFLHYRSLKKSQITGKRFRDTFLETIK